MDIKVSIIIPVLNSHEIVRRQLMHFVSMDIPEDTEVILVDDGSNPPITAPPFKWLTILKTNDFREWTWPLARNAGARIARGEYFIMVDLDHIVTLWLIECVRHFLGDFIRFHREFAILDENGVLDQDLNILKDYGLTRKSVKLTPHRNQFAIHRNLYFKMGGYIEDRIGLPYPQREDGEFSKAWDRLYAKGEVRDFDDLLGYDLRPTLYMFPNGKYCGDVDHNPFGLFHNLSRKTEKNPFYERPKHINPGS